MNLRTEYQALKDIKGPYSIQQDGSLSMYLDRHALGHIPPCFYICPLHVLISLTVKAEPANLAIVTCLLLLSKITIIYFIYQTAGNACSLPPPVSDALCTPPNGPGT